MIPLFTVNMPPKEILMPRLEEVLYSGYIGQGPKVEEFEEKFGKWLGNKNVLSLNSGTSALHLALRLANVKGGEVITTPMTCTATNMPILANGAKIVWADINPRTGNIDPEDVERKITKRTKAIMIVHWGGNACDMEAFEYIRSKYGIPIIEDAAHALGAAYEGRKIGTISDFTCFSLQAIKHITTVDGGILAVRETDDYKRGKLLRWYGIDREGDRKDFRCEEDIKEWGYKFHMNDVTAAIGIAQLDYLDAIVAAHQNNAAYYSIKLLPSESLLQPQNDNWGAWWLYTVQAQIPSERPALMYNLQQAGIQVSRVHERNDKHTAFREFVKNLPGVDEFSSKMFCIPVHAKLTEEDRKKIVNAILQYDIRYHMGP